MRAYKIAEPDYDFELVHTSGKDIIGQSFFSSEMSILKCTQGEATIFINSRTHKFLTGTNFLLTEKLLFKVVDCSADFMMTSCRFSTRFFNEVYPILNNKVIDVLDYSAPDICSVEQMDATDMTFRQLCNIHQHTDHAYRHKIMVNLVVNYLLQIYELTYHQINIQSAQNTHHRNHVLGSFCVLCGDHHTKQRDIKFYAERLNISTRYLYTISKEGFKATPKQVIDYYVLGTAKKMLLTSVLTSQQISNKLNFPDQSTFGQFFKRNVGMSPMHFRNRYK